MNLWIAISIMNVTLLVISEKLLTKHAFCNGCLLNKSSVRFSFS